MAITGVSNPPGIYIECGTVGTPIFHTDCATPQSVVWCLYKLWNLVNLNRLNNNEVN